MSTSVTLYKFTDQGIKNVKDSPQRLNAAIKAFEAKGGKILNSRAQTDDKAWGMPAEWVDYTGPVGGKTVEYVDMPVGVPPGAPEIFSDYFKLMADLMVLSWQTDMTRVITFQMAIEQSNRAYREINISDSHHGLTHHGGDKEKIEKAGGNVLGVVLNKRRNHLPQVIRKIL